MALLLGGCAGLVQQERTDEFFADLGSTSIKVYPTYIKRMAKNDSGKPLGHDSEDSSYDSGETQRLAAFLRCQCLADVTVSTEEVPLDREWQWTQYGILKASSRAFGDYVAAHPIETEYAMMAEYVIPHSNVWAVHLYVVNAKGELVWIAHLNSHFDVFRNINPQSPSEGTRVLLAFLRTGLPDTSGKCAAHEAAAAVRTPPGVLYDFEAELPSGFDSNGIPLGFSTFSDGKSSVRISRTDDHPTREEEATGNHVLRLDLDVVGWAGFVNIFENESNDTWTPRDWSAHDGFSFWLYGNDSGASLFVDVIDNRKSCSDHDDGERFTYEFVDDFSGWKRITVRFADMRRKDIGNRAPDDGLGLSDTHGWGFGASRTTGPTTYYIDDFALNPKPAADRTPR
jgi:hypothetical protein